LFIKVELGRGVYLAAAGGSNRGKIQIFQRFCQKEGFHLIFRFRIGNGHIVQTPVHNVGLAVTLQGLKDLSTPFSIDGITCQLIFK
jgi:hypothetical protein